MTVKYIPSYYADIYNKYILLIYNYLNKFIINTLFNKNFWIYFKYKKYNLNTNFNKNNTFSYYTLNINKYA